MNSLNIISKEQLTYTFRDNYTYFEETFSSCDLTYSLPSHDYWRSVLLSLFNILLINYEFVTVHKNKNAKK